MSKATIPCPHCAQPIKHSWMRGKLNQIAGQLGGRPKSEDRCPCGSMTLQRAKSRNHVCKIEGH